MKSTYAMALAVCGLMIGVARADKPKSYEIVLSDAKIGSTDLNAGSYKLMVHLDEPKVQLMELKSGRITDFPAQVDQTGSKVNGTEVRSTTVDGERQISEIRVGGTKLRITFKKGA